MHLTDSILNVWKLNVLIDMNSHSKHVLLIPCHIWEHLFTVSDILLLDEPTTGLDSFTARHLVASLQQIARQGKLVMLSLHQPRSDIAKMLDQTALMSSGHVMYCGPTDHMVPYFTELGYPSPTYANPLDTYSEYRKICWVYLEVLIFVLLHSVFSSCDFKVGEQTWECSIYSQHTARSQHLGLRFEGVVTRPRARPMTYTLKCLFEILILIPTSEVYKQNTFCFKHKNYIPSRGSPINSGWMQI